MDALGPIVAVALVVGQMAQVGLLTGVFYRLGRLASTQDAHADEIAELKAGRG